jgi:hypothetical protein
MSCTYFAVPAASGNYVTARTIGHLVYLTGAIST